MKDRFFIGSCVKNPFSSVQKLSDIIDNSREITRTTFLSHCSVRDIHFPYNIDGVSLKKNMEMYPNDFSFHKSKFDSFLTKTTVYFFTHSCIEYFYM